MCGEVHDITVAEQLRDLPELEEVRLSEKISTPGNALLVGKTILIGKVNMHAVDIYSLVAMIVRLMLDEYR